jgi:hypothetical protein
MSKHTIYVEGSKPAREALELMTDNWIENGDYCTQTVFDLRDYALYLQEMLGKQGEMLTKMVHTMKDGFDCKELEADIKAMREHTSNTRINHHILESTKQKNQDAYGAACVQVAVNVMNYLDTFDEDFNIGYSPDLTTPHGIVCYCDDAGGITGFMAGCVRNTVTVCHTLGWKFYIADVLDAYSMDKLSAHDKIVNDLVECEHINITEPQIRDYIKELVTRYKSRGHAAAGNKDS